jgi:hypothetical protein
MRPDHLLCLFVVPCLQAMLLLSAATNPPGSVTTKPIAILALVLPIACYVWGLRDAPIGPKTARRAVRLAVLSLVAMGLSSVGFIIGLELIASHVPSMPVSSLH